MIIKNIKVEGYKNLSQINISLDQGVNIFCGDNAQGKTNLMEAVWLCSGCRSFRTSKEKDIVGFEKEFAEVNLDFDDYQRSQKIKFKFKRGGSKEKAVFLNEVKLNSMSKLFGNFMCAVFTPEDLSLSKGSPENRRAFSDISIAQIKPSYINAVNVYSNILSQRNAYLKKLRGQTPDFDVLDIWNEQIAKAGSYISVLRKIFCNNLNRYSARLYNSISGGKEKLTLFYSSTVFKDIPEDTKEIEGLKEIYLSKLKKTIKDDIRQGFTTVGAHRDDIVTEINGRLLREIGSQGQARSAALVMKLSAANILAAEKKDPPVILLDDVLSELDTKRGKFVLDNIGGMQTLITCCDERMLSLFKEGKMFHVEQGKITGY